MLFCPFYGVMYGCVIRKMCVACIYMRAYIIISTCVRAKEMDAFKNRSCVFGVHFAAVVSYNCYFFVCFSFFSHLILIFVASNGLAFA